MEEIHSTQKLYMVSTWGPGHLLYGNTSEEHMGLQLLEAEGGNNTEREREKRREMANEQLA